MAVLLSRNYFCVVDNVSSLNKKMSDILCQAVTGGAKYKRKLYTDDEEVIVEYRAILAMNGINNIISQDDLLQRTIFLSAKSIAVNERKLEKDFWDNFQKDLPYILGAIFDIASEVLRDIDKVQLRIFNRLADFNKYGYAISEAICVGYSKKFMKAMEKNKQKQLWCICEKMPQIRLLVDFMENKNKWEGLMSDFLTELEDYVNNHPEDTSEKDIPSNIALPKICKKFESDLLSLGLEIKISRTTKENKSFIKIIKRRNDLKRIPIQLERKAIITDKK